MAEGLTIRFLSDAELWNAERWRLLQTMRLAETYTDVGMSPLQRQRRISRKVANMCSDLIERKYDMMGHGFRAKIQDGDDELDTSPRYEPTAQWLLDQREWILRRKQEIVNREVCGRALEGMKMSLQTITEFLDYEADRLSGFYEGTKKWRD